MDAPANVGPVDPTMEAPGTLIVACSLILLMSLVAAWFSFVRPVSGMISARGWVEHECEITTSKVERNYNRNSSGKGTISESLTVVYRYVYAGRVHVADDVDFYGGFAFRDSVRADIIARFPEGT